MIAMSISCKPELLIADEPTTALDVAIQAQILDLLDELRRQNRMSVLIITHNLGIIAEKAESGVLYDKPFHPYTRALMSAIPQIDPSLRKKRTVLKGEVPSIVNPPSGCPFHPRCPISKGFYKCIEQMPPLEEKEDEHFVACWKYDNH